MSSGDTPPVRFTSPSSTSASAKKYPGTPKSPMLNNSNTSSSSNNSNTNTGNRNSQARQRLLSSKISAPRPINLPSLRREHAVGTDVPAASPATSHGWGSASSSPCLSQQQQPAPHSESDASEKKHDTETTHDKSSKPSDTAAASPVLIPATAAASTRAWAVPAMTHTKVPPPSTDFPTAAEAASGTKKKPSLIDDKEYLKFASSDPNHRSWDEMVSEDLDDFSVDVVEFDDGTKVQVGSDASSVGSHASASRTTEPVLPSERFTDDYDRSYPPKQPYHHQHHHHPPPPPQPHYHHQQHHDNDPHHTNYKPYRRSEDHGYNARYNSNTNYNSRRHSSGMDGGNERRTSGTSDRWNASTASTRRESTDHPSHYGHRRPSYDRKYDNNGPYHPTSLLQRPRRLSEQSFKSDHSREDVSNPLHIIPEPTTTTTTATNATPETSTEEIIVVQKNLMLTAAERAKKRLEEQEAEFKAAAERAKQKADALAAKQEELKAKTILKKPAAAAAAASVNTTPLSKKAAASPSSASAAINKASVKASSSSPPPSNATTTQAPKASLPPKLPDTSKPWNLVAANKQVPPTTPTSPAVAAVATPSSEAKDKAKDLPSSQTPKEPSSLPSSDHQPTQIRDNKEKKPITIMKKEPKPALKPKEEKKDQVVEKPVEEKPVEEKQAEKKPVKEKPVEGKPVEEEKQEDSKSKKPLTEDEKKWQKFVSTIKTDHHVTVEKEVTSTDWNSYADRLQETTAEQDAIAASIREKLIRQVEQEIQENQQQKQPQTVEVFDYTNEEWGAAPVSRSMDHGAWTLEDSTYNSQRGHRKGRSGRGSRGAGTSKEMGRTSNHTNAKSRTSTHATTDQWRQDTTAAEEEVQEEKQPIVVEILKKKEPVLSKKTRLTNLLKESSSPIFPDFIDKLAAKKPANMSFMVETEESDKEITMMGQEDTSSAAVEEEKEDEVEEDEAASIATTVENSPVSTPPKSQFPSSQQQQHNQRRLNVNRHFPVLVYQYPQAQSVSTSDHLGSPSSSMDVGSKSPSAYHPQSPQNRPLGVYLMPQQPFLTSNQYVVPYPQLGTSNVQPIYYPTLSWQQQQQQQQHAGMSARPNTYDHRHHRRPYNDYPANASNGYRQQHKYSSGYQHTSNGRGNSYRKRGGGGGAGGAAVQSSGASRGGNNGHYQTTHNSSYSKKYSRNDTDVAANPAVDIQQPSL